MDSHSNVSGLKLFLAVAVFSVCVMNVQSVSAQDYTVSGTDSMSGSHNYDTFRVESGATLYLNGRNLDISANEIIINGEINGQGDGYAGGNSGDGSGPGGGPETWANSGGGGYGAQGGCGPESGAPSCAESGGDSYGSRTSRSNIRAGSGGGGEGSNDNGGNGGGGVSLEANIIQISGTINMDGQDADASSSASYGGGGGAGGGILIDGGTVDLSGAHLTAEGGDAGNGYGGSGAGGRIKIFYGTLNSGYSTNVNGVDSHTYGGNLLENGAIGEDGTVYTERISNPQNPVIGNINYDTTAGNPATIEGSFDVTVYHDDGNAPNNQLESCTVTAEGTDSGGQAQSGNVNGDTCSFSFNNNQNNWNPDEELRLTVQVEDSYGGTDQIGQFKQFPVNPPNAPDNPQPTDGEQGVSTGHDLSVTASHPDGLNDMEISFQINEGNGFQHVDTTTAGNGDTATVQPDLNPGTQYTWKASASKQSRTNESSEWSFTTNYRPTVESMDIEALEKGHAVNFSAVVTDEDGRENIDDCSLVVEDQDGNEYVPPVTVENGDSADEALCSVNGIDFQDASWSHTDELQFELTVTDDQGLSDSDTASSSLPNHGPSIQDLSTTEYPDREAFRISSLIGAVDFNRSELRSCNLVIDDGENSYSAGKMVPVNSTHVRCIEENVGSGQFSSLTVDEEIMISLRATDIHGATSSDQLAFNVPTGIDYRYSALIISSGGVDFLPFQVSNNQGVDTRYRVKLQNVNASFSDGGATKTFTVSGGSAETLDIMVSPEIGFTGTKTLEIVTENLNTGINQTNEIPVQVLEKGESSKKPVPAPGLLHLLVIVAIATIAFTKSI